LVPIVVEPQVELAIVEDLKSHGFGCDATKVVEPRVELAIVEDLKSHGFGCDATRVVEP
jgi:hypothetical protein